MKTAAAIDLETTPLARARAVLPSQAEKIPSATAYEFDPLCDARWTKLVESHPRASVFHSISWLKTLSDVYGYKPVAVTTCAPDQPLTNGIVFCQIDSWLTGRRLVSLPFSDHCEPFVRDADELDQLLAHVTKAGFCGKSGYVEIRPPSCKPGRSTGFVKSSMYYFHRLDLDKSTEQLFQSFHRSCVQRKIRRAEQERLRYEEGTSKNLLHDFYNLLVITRRRQHLPPQPFSWFTSLMAAFGDQLKIRVAYKDHLAIASILTLSHNVAMVYKYGCSKADCNNLGGMALLLWRAIQEAKERGFEEFDMGRSDMDEPGLIAFKERWGATGRPLQYWAYRKTLETNKSVWEKKAIHHLVSISPKLVLQAAGTLLYRHMG